MNNICLFFVLFFSLSVPALAADACVPGNINRDVKKAEKSLAEIIRRLRDHNLVMTPEILAEVNRQVKVIGKSFAAGKAIADESFDGKDTRAVIVHHNGVAISARAESTIVMMRFALNRRAGRDNSAELAILNRDAQLIKGVREALAKFSRAEMAGAAPIFTKKYQAGFCRAQ